jgi:hypothetical protein
VRKYLEVGRDLSKSCVRLERLRKTAKNRTMCNMCWIRTEQPLHDCRRAGTPGVNI